MVQGFQHMKSTRIVIDQQGAEQFDRRSVFIRFPRKRLGTEEKVSRLRALQLHAVVFYPVRVVLIGLFLPHTVDGIGKSEAPDGRLQ